MENSSLEELYGISKNPVDLTRHVTKSGKWLETFESPVKAWTESEEFGEPTIGGDRGVRGWKENRYTVELEFPEFTCRCPRTGHPDFATIILRYKPNERCVEMKSLKYYLNSFRDEGHFHEQVCNLIYGDLYKILQPIEMQVVGQFNPRGGTYPVVTVGEWGS